MICYQIDAKANHERLDRALSLTSDPRWNFLHRGAMLRNGLGEHFAVVAKQAPRQIADIASEVGFVTSSASATRNRLPQNDSVVAVANSENLSRLSLHSGLCVGAHCQRAMN